jgi:hypothetical protein
LRSAAYHAVAGTDVKMAAQQMEAQLRRDSIRAFTDKSGRNWSLPNYTTMVIRTTTREAVTQGTFNGLVQTGHEIYQVSHHEHACELCLKYDGKTFAMPDAPESILTKYSVAPGGLLCPYHPRCKHVIAPASVSFDMIEAELLAKYGGGKLPKVEMAHA